jgi:hypothetical protein
VLTALTVVAIGVLLLSIYLFNRLWLREGGIKPPINSIPSALPELTQEQAKVIDLYLREWQVVIQTQMHFNDLIIRFRSVALTSFVALAGAAVTVSNAFELDGAALGVVMVLPFIFWIAALAIDLFYYHELLLGAVAEAAKFDEAAWLSERGFFGLTKCIRNHATPRSARIMVLLFYFVPLAAGTLLVLWAGQSLRP